MWKIVVNTLQDVGVGRISQKGRPKQKQWDSQWSIGK